MPRVEQGARASGLPRRSRPVDGALSMLQRTGRIRNLPGILAGGVRPRWTRRGQAPTQPSARRAVGSLRGDGRGHREQGHRRLVEAPRVRERARGHPRDRPPGRAPHQGSTWRRALVVEQEGAQRRCGTVAHGADRAGQERGPLGRLEHRRRRPASAAAPTGISGFATRTSSPTRLRAVRRILAMVGMEDAHASLRQRQRGAHDRQPQRRRQPGPAAPRADHAALATTAGGPPWRRVTGGWSARSRHRCCSATATRCGPRSRKPDPARRSSIGRPPVRAPRRAPPGAFAAIFAGAAPRGSRAWSRRTSSTRSRALGSPPRSGAGAGRIPRAAGLATPVYLVGLQRSGTNMLARGLDIAPEFEVHNENDRDGVRPLPASRRRRGPPRRRGQRPRVRAVQAALRLASRRPSPRHPRHAIAGSCHLGVPRRRRARALRGVEVRTQQPADPARHRGRQGRDDVAGAAALSQATLDEISSYDYSTMTRGNRGVALLVDPQRSVLRDGTRPPGRRAARLIPGHACDAGRRDAGDLPLSRTRRTALHSSRTSRRAVQAARARSTSIRVCARSVITCRTAWTRRSAVSAPAPQRRGRSDHGGRGPADRAAVGSRDLPSVGSHRHRRDGRGDRRPDPRHQHRLPFRRRTEDRRVLRCGTHPDRPRRGDHRRGEPGAGTGVPDLDDPARRPLHRSPHLDGDGRRRSSSARRWWC